MIPRLAQRAALIALASLTVAACGQSPSGRPDRGASSTAPATSTSRGSLSLSPTAPTPSSPAAAAAARAQAVLFARGYARYLDGTLTAAGLPGAALSARAQAGPPLPVSARAGRLHVASITALVGSRYLATIKDRAHRFAVTLTVSAAGGRAIVVSVVAPDLDSILNDHTAAISQPAASGLARRAATRFLAGYLPWLYGHGRAALLRDAAPALIAGLRAHPPRIPITLQGLSPRLAALGMQAAGPGWRAVANVTDGQQTYELSLALTREHGKWRVTTVKLP